MCIYLYYRQKQLFLIQHYNKMHRDLNTTLPQNILWEFLVSTALQPGTYRKKIFKFPYCLSHNDKENRILWCIWVLQKKKSEQTGCQHSQFTELEQKKNSTEKPQSARDKKIRLQITQFIWCTLPNMSCCRQQVFYLNENLRDPLLLLTEHLLGNLIQHTEVTQASIK